MVVESITWVFSMEGGTITGNHAGELGGGVFDAQTASNPRFRTTLALSGSPVVSGNTAGESENGAGDNVVLTRTSKDSHLWEEEVPLALITLGELTDGAKIGLSVYDYDDINYSGYDYITPTLDSPVQFTMAETDMSYYADSSQYFFQTIQTGEDQWR